MHIEYLLNERAFLNKWVYDEAEKAYYCKTGVSASSGGITSSITDEVTKLRQQLQNQLGSVDTSSLNVNDLVNRLNKLELENNDLRTHLKSLETRIAQLESGNKPAAAAPAKPAAAAAPAAAKSAPKKDDNDDDFDLFGDDDDKDEEESEEKKKLLKAYAEKKAKKPEIIAKSNIIMDVKPWDDETDMKKLEESVRSVAMDGLLWGTSKLVPIAYGIKKLQITCVIEDDKVSTELLEEKLVEFEDYIQSVDIVSFNKI